jgi:uncharacterized phage protein gp47/JayE
VDFPTRLDLYGIGRAYMLTRAQLIDPNEVDKRGSDANLFVGSGAVMLAHIVRHLAYATARLFLDSAEGDDLDRLVFDRYGEARKGATPAVGTVRFWRVSTAAGNGTIPIGTKLVALNGAEYITTTAAHFGALDLTATADVRAVQAGKAPQVGRNQIRKFAPSNAVFDTTLQLTNDDPTAHGEDREDDETFRNRMRNFWLSVRRGTLGAIEFGALTVPGIVSATAVEAIEGTASPARIVNLYIADSSGVASAAMTRTVIAALADYRAAGIRVIVWPSMPSIVSIVLKLAFQSGVDTVTLTQQVITAVIEYVNSLPVSAPLLVGELAAVLVRFKQNGLIVNSGSIVAPAGDVYPDPGMTLRTTIANVTEAA